MSVWFSSISFVDDNVAPQCQEFGLAYKDIKKVFFLMQNITEQRKQLYEPSTPGCTPQQLAQHMLTSLRLVFFFHFRGMCTFRWKCTTSETLFSVRVPVKRVHTQGNFRRMFQGCGLGQETTEERVTAGEQSLSWAHMEEGRGTRPRVPGGSG